MTTKQFLFSLSLLAVLGACSKSTNEPVLPSTQSGEPRVGLSLSGGIEFPDLDPDLPIGGGSAKDLTLHSFTRPSDGKRFVTPFFNNDKLPALFCIYDGYGNSYFFRAAIEVSTTMSSNGQMVNKFHFNDKEIAGNNGKGLPDNRFKFVQKTDAGGRKQNSGIISYGQPGHEDVYVAIFLGLNPKSNNPDYYANHLLPENQTYTHGGWETLMGQNVDYTSAGANTSQTRIIFGTTPGKHKLTLNETGGTGLGTSKGGPEKWHILGSDNLKLQMRGVLLECEIENKSLYDATLTSMRVSKWGGHTVTLHESTTKSVKKGGTTVDEVDVLPDLEPDRGGDGRGPYDPFEIKFSGTDAQKTVRDNETVKRIIYLPLVNALSNGKVTKTAATLRLRYTINGRNMADEKLLRPLKRDGFMASTKFTITGKLEKN